MPSFRKLLSERGNIATKNIKELIVVVVLMPVILSLYNSEAYHRVVHLTKSLVVSLELARIRKNLFVDYL